MNQRCALPYALAYLVRSWAGVAIACVITVGCADRDVSGGAAKASRAPSNWRAEVDTVGDTVVVKTVSGSEWGTAHLVEELRIGVADGEEHLMFGEIAALAVHKNGEIVVYDAQATALRRFGPDGTYLGAILRAGSGPGEYQNVAGMAVLTDDRLVIHDFGNQRFNVYGADGTYLEAWHHTTNVAEMRPIDVNRDGSIFLYDLIARGNSPEPAPVLVRLNERGDVGDTTVIPLVSRVTPGLVIRSARRSFGARIPFYPEAHWTVLSGRDVVTVDGARYAIDIRRPDGSVLRLTRALDDVAVSAEERGAEVERITAMFRRQVPAWNWDGPSIPATKPAITWLHAGEDASLWMGVAQQGAAIPVAERTPNVRSWVREPLAFDVFSADGHYRGRVMAPDAMKLSPYPVFRADRVWAVTQDENGVNYVVRFRIVHD